MHAAKENIVKKDNSIAAECVCPLKIPLTVWVSLWKRATVRQPPVSMHVSCNLLLFEEHFWKALFSWWICVDERPNLRNSAAFSNFYGEGYRKRTGHEKTVDFETPICFLHRSNKPYLYASIFQGSCY